MGKKQKEEVKTDGWLATFSDTMTLLLTFFVMLYAMSTVSEDKLRQISNSFQLVFTGQVSQNILNLNEASGEVPVVGQPEIVDGERKNMEYAEDKVYKEILDLIKQNNMENEIDVYEDKKGINIQMKETVLFDSGNAELVPASKNILEKVNNIISGVNNKIIIEGHTDNVPINSEIYPSNWQLSSARALSVLQYFINEKGNKNPERFTAAAYGEYSPLVPNDSDVNRAKNRRVNIIIVTDKKE